MIVFGSINAGSNNAVTTFPIAFTQIPKIIAGFSIPNLVGVYIVDVTLTQFKQKYEARAGYQSDYIAIGN